MKSVYFYITFILFSQSVSSQVVQEWANTYNHLTSQDVAQGLVVDNSGNIYALGWVNNGVSTMTDYGLIKYNSAGVQQWFRQYSSTGAWLDYGDDIAMDNSGNVYVTGRVEAIAGNANCVTIKYAPNGDSLWVRKYDFGICRKILVDNNSNVYVIGKRGDAAFSDFLIVKYNSAGSELWARTYTGAGGYPDEALAAAVDSAGNVIITGIVSIPPQNAIVTIKYDAAGTQLWLATYQCAAAGGDWGNDIAVDNAGNIYITGSSDTIPSIGRTFLTLKYNSSGGREWVTRYYGGWPPTTSVDSRSMALFENNYIYVAGYAVYSATNYDYVVLKYNTNGVQQWVSTYHSGVNDLANKIALDDSGNAYVTGLASNLSSANEDAVTVKFNSAGTQQWVARYNGVTNSIDESRDVVVKNGIVYIAGRTFSTANSDDFLVIKYSQVVGVQIISSEVPREYLLGQNYPNPFNPVTNIQFNIIKSGFTKIVVYDAAGREVETLVNGELNAGIYIVGFDASKLASGLYFYRLTSGEYSEVKKMMVVK